MKIERTASEIIIRLPAKIDDKVLDKVMQYFDIVKSFKGVKPLRFRWINWRKNQERIGVMPIKQVSLVKVGSKY
jgi:hypothetical protein